MTRRLLAVADYTNWLAVLLGLALLTVLLLFGAGLVLVNAVLANTT